MWTVTERGATALPASCGCQRGGSGEQARLLAWRRKAARAPARRCLQEVDTRWAAVPVLMAPAPWPAAVPGVPGLG